MSAEIPGVTVPEFDNDGNQRVSSVVMSGEKYNIYSHNWCDKTTWYQESTKVTEEVLSDSGDSLTFNSSNTFWIDLTHGRQTNENYIIDETGDNSYIPIILINDVPQTSGFSINNWRKS